MQTIKLNLTPGGANQRVYLSQYDVGRQIKFLLFDEDGAYTPATGSTVKIRATKPSGFGFDVSCTWSSNEVIATVTEDMSLEYGSFAAELRIEKDDDILGTSNFIWNVERSTHLEGTVDGNEEARGLLQDIQDAIQTASTSTLSIALKQALLQIAGKVAYVDEDGQDYYNALYNALYPPADLSSISAVYTQSGTVYDTDNLDTLKNDLAVTAHYDDGSSEQITSYALSGVLTQGTSTITVSYGGKTATFSVTVTHIQTYEIISTFAANVHIDASTYENIYEVNNWVCESTIKARKVSLAWDTAQCNIFQIEIAQFDESGDPYKHSSFNRYASNPVTDGELFDTTAGAWSDPGSNRKFTAIGGGNITINLPTYGKFKVSLRRSTGSGSSVDTNDAFGAWINGGGITITAYVQ